MKRVAYKVGMCAILFLSSCARFTHWTRQTFHSAQKFELGLDLTHGNLRRVRAYDQLNTVALFDVLWLSGEVRQTYVDLYALKHYAAPEEIEHELYHQKIEHDDFITFYIMMPEEDGIAFGDMLGKWTMALEVNGSFYQPESVEIMYDLADEWRKILGDSYNCFKIPYEVKFDARAMQAIPILNSLVNEFTLCVSSAEYREYCSFNFIPEQTEMHHVYKG